MRPRFVQFIAAIVAVFLVLFGLNLYQYFRVKQKVGTAIIKEVSSSDFAEIQRFFDGITTKLNIVRDWGQNGVLTISRPVDLNKKFWPLIDHQPYLYGLFLANDAGEEYFLEQRLPNYVTRTTKQTDDGAEQSFHEWKSPEKSIRQWQKTSDCDPRKRPWFRSDKSDSSSAFFTNVYAFNSGNQKGFTASTSWQNNQHVFVFGIDILLTEIQRLLAEINTGSATHLCLVNAQNNAYIMELASSDEHAGALKAPFKDHFPDEIITLWQDKGRMDGEPVTLKDDGHTWIASFLPIDPQQKRMWVGVIADQDELLRALDTSFFRLDLLDIGIALLIGSLLFLFFARFTHAGKQTKTVSPEERFRQFLSQGEGESVEFKSTVRFNLKTEKNGKEIELAWLKAVTAFLNCRGGALLLGVDDSGNVLGLDADSFDNQDKCLLHLKNLIHQHIGAEFASFVSYVPVVLESKFIVMLEVQQAGSPVFLKIGKNEEFYIRSGPSSVKLTPSQMVRFIQNQDVDLDAYEKEEG